VTPPATAPESDVERSERVDALTGTPDSTLDDPPPTVTPADGDALAAQEANAAAAEAARIGASHRARAPMTRRSIRCTRPAAGRRRAGSRPRPI
jgi:hypothetical protein